MEHFVSNWVDYFYLKEFPAQWVSQPVLYIYK